MNAELVQEYKTKIQPILPLAKKAFGSRNQETPAHDASREYTRLLIEFHKRGGSLPQLAKALKVAITPYFLFVNFVAISVEFKFR